MSMIEHTPASASADATSPGGPASSIQRGLERAADSAAKAFTDRLWAVLHVLGAHRWSEGYEVDPERGMTRYRGSRCTICDSPWEGW